MPRQTAKELEGDPPLIERRTTRSSSRAARPTEAAINAHTALLRPRTRKKNDDQPAGQQSRANTARRRVPTGRGRPARRPPSRTQKAQVNDGHVSNDNGDDSSGGDASDNDSKASDAGHVSNNEDGNSNNGGHEDNEKGNASPEGNNGDQGGDNDNVDAANADGDPGFNLNVDDSSNVVDDNADIGDADNGNADNGAANVDDPLDTQHDMAIDKHDQEARQGDLSAPSMLEDNTADIHQTEVGDVACDDRRHRSQQSPEPHVTDRPTSRVVSIHRQALHAMSSLHLDDDPTAHQSTKNMMLCVEVPLRSTASRRLQEPSVLPNCRTRDGDVEMSASCPPYTAHPSTPTPLESPPPTQPRRRRKGPPGIPGYVLSPADEQVHVNVNDPPRMRSPTPIESDESGSDYLSTVRDQRDRRKHAFLRRERNTESEDNSEDADLAGEVVPEDATPRKRGDTDKGKGREVVRRGDIDKGKGRAAAEEDDASESESDSETTLEDWEKTRGPLSDEAKAECVALGQHLKGQVAKVARKYGKSVAEILVQSGFGIQEGRAPNPANEHSQWYSRHYPKAQGVSPQEYNAEIAAAYSQLMEGVDRSDKVAVNAAMKDIREWLAQNADQRHAPGKSIRSITRLLRRAKRQFTDLGNAYSNIEEVEVVGMLLYVGADAQARQLSTVFAGSDLVARLIDKYEVDVEATLDTFTTALKSLQMGLDVEVPAGGLLTNSRSKVGAKSSNAATGAVPKWDMLRTRFIKVLNDSLDERLLPLFKKIPWLSFDMKAITAQCRLINWPDEVPFPGPGFSFGKLRIGQLELLVKKPAPAISTWTPEEMKMGYYDKRRPNIPLIVGTSGNILLRIRDVNEGDKTRPIELEEGSDDERTVEPGAMSTPPRRRVLAPPQSAPASRVANYPPSGSPQAPNAKRRRAAEGGHAADVARHEPSGQVTQHRSGLEYLDLDISSDGGNVRDQSPAASRPAQQGHLTQHRHSRPADPRQIPRRRDPQGRREEPRAPPHHSQVPRQGPNHAQQPQLARIPAVPRQQTRPSRQPPQRAEQRQTSRQPHPQTEASNARRPRPDPQAHPYRTGYSRPAINGLPGKPRPLQPRARADSDRWPQQYRDDRSPEPGPSRQRGEAFDVAPQRYMHDGRRGRADEGWDDGLFESEPDAMEVEGGYAGDEDNRYFGDFDDDNY